LKAEIKQIGLISRNSPVFYFPLSVFAQGKATPRQFATRFGSRRPSYPCMSNFVSIAWTYVPLNPCLSRFTNRALQFAPSESRSGTQNWSQGSQNAILRIPQIANLRYNLGLADNPGAPGIFAAPQNAILRYESRR